MEQNILDEIYKISICEKIKNFTNKNNKLCSKINCDKIKNSTKNSKKLQKIENSMKISKIVSSKIKYFSNNHKNIYQLCWCKSWTNRSCGLKANINTNRCINYSKMREKFAEKCWFSIGNALELWGETKWIDTVLIDVVL